LIRHVVLLRWSTPLDDAAERAFASALDALPTQIPEIVTYDHGPDVGVAAGNFDYAVTATFARPDDFPTYRDHPAHQAMVAEHIAPRLAERAAVQFVLTD
jgi:hypothetical protein